jgi:LysM repeat protein
LKNFISAILLLFFAAAVQAQSAKVYISDSIQEMDGKEYYVHTVMQGQTVYSIAKAYEVSIDEVYYVNPETREGISVDQVLLVPTVSKEAELGKEVRSRDFKYFYHIAGTAEKFSYLAIRYNIPESYIRAANPGLSDPFREGEYIKIPVDEAFSTLEEQAADYDEDVSFDPALPFIPDFRHSVVAGETLYSISRKYGVTVDQLRSVNPGLAATLEIGDRLRIPIVEDVAVEEDQAVEDVKPQEKKEPAYYDHRVKKKETLYAISRIYGVTVQDLYDANPGLTPSIDQGQVIKVPNKYIDKPYVIYTASKKTKLNKIGKLYQIPVSKIQKENPSLSNRILPGQKVRIPVGTKAKIQKEPVEEEPPEEPVAEEPEEIIPVRAGCDKIMPDFEAVFKIALMVPLYAEEIDSLDVEKFLMNPAGDFKPFRYIRFLEGALMAIDSLRNKGFNIELYVYDVDNSITKTIKVLQGLELRTMDLIIGPFHSKSFDQVALFAGNFDIPIVNPFSFREEILKKYSSVIKVKSGTAYQAELIAPLIEAYYPGAQIYLITHTAYQNVDEVSRIQNNIMEVLDPGHYVLNTDLHNLAVAIAFRDVESEEEEEEKAKEIEEGPLPVYKFEGRDIYPEILAAAMEDSTLFENKLTRINYMKDSLYPFFETASPLRRNLAIIYGESKAFVMDVMNRLNEYRDTFDIKIIGMPTLERFSNLDHIQANNMNLTYFSTTYVNYDADEIQDFIFRFREAYNTDPGIYGFSGFDITYYFTDALVHLGNRMRSCFDQYPENMILNKYEIKKTGFSRNFENSYWNVVRYQQFSRIKLPDPKKARKTEN